MRWRRWGALLAAMGAIAAVYIAVRAGEGSVAVSPNPSGLSFHANFSSVAPWTSAGGGVQCANYGTPSKSPRLRGSFHLDANVGGVANAGRITLPANPDPTTYPLEACGLLTGSQPMVLAAERYYGLMVYVPSRWSIPNSFFTGIEIEEYHFQNIHGAPIAFQLHADHVTLALQTGACRNHATASPGCAYHSNADSPNGKPGNLPAAYVIPPGAFRQGAWNEMVMHVRWASGGTGQIQTWYRVKGAAGWTRSSNLTGIPTVQWDVKKGCCASGYVDETEAYTGAVSAPVSLWLGNDVAGSTFASVAASMP